MGRGLKDVAHAENAPYDFVDAPGMLQLKTAAGTVGLLIDPSCKELVKDLEEVCFK